MEIIPAIDILDGRVVRLRKGDTNTSINVSDKVDPLSVATRWVEEGAKRLHIIDLDAATGRGSNEAIIVDIIQKIVIPVQVGGGLRSLEKARGSLNYGADRIILGTLALESPLESSELALEYGIERVVIALDHKNGFIAINGWKECSSVKLFDAFNYFKQLGFSRFLITDVNRDGEMTGPDIQTYCRLAPQANIIASGGIRSISDLRKLRE